MIQVTTNEVKKDFPKIMSFKQYLLVVFYITANKGIVLQSSDKDRPIGHYREDWCPDNFNDYDEPVTIQNV